MITKVKCYLTNCLTQSVLLLPPGTFRALQQQQNMSKNKCVLFAYIGQTSFATQCTWILYNRGGMTQRLSSITFDDCDYDNSGSC